VCLEQCIQQNYRSPTILFRGWAPRRGRATCSRFQGPRILDIVPPEGGELSTATRYGTWTAKRATRCSTTRPSTPRRGAATIGRIDTICGTWNADRGTRCSMPPKGAATLCHIDTRYSMLSYPQDIPRRGCDILSHTRCSRIIFYLTQDLVPPKGCDNLTH
jgi:hypothetical protein